MCKNTFAEIEFTEFIRMRTSHLASTGLEDESTNCPIVVNVFRIATVFQIPVTSRTSKYNVIGLDAVAVVNRFKFLKYMVFPDGTVYKGTCDNEFPKPLSKFIME